MFGLGIQEILVIVVLVLLLFDHKKIPEVARGLGKVYRDIISVQEKLKNEIIRGDIKQDLMGEDSKQDDSKLDNTKLEKTEKDYDESGRAG